MSFSEYICKPDNDVYDKHSQTLCGAVVYGREACILYFSGAFECLHMCCEEFFSSNSGGDWASMSSIYGLVSSINLLNNDL